MTEIVNKCETAYSLIQKCQNNDSALVDEKRRIYGLVDEVCDLMEKVVLEPKETSNLTYYFEYDITCILETQIGEIRVLKPGQKGLLWVIRNSIIWELLDGIDLESIEWIVAYVIVEELWNPPLWQELSAVWIMNKK